MLQICLWNHEKGHTGKSGGKKRYFEREAMQASRFLETSVLSCPTSFFNCIAPSLSYFVPLLHSFLSCNVSCLCKPFTGLVFANLGLQATLCKYLPRTGGIYICCLCRSVSSPPNQAVNSIYPVVNISFTSIILSWPILPITS